MAAPWMTVEAFEKYSLKVSYEDHLRQKQNELAEYEDKIRNQVPPLPLFEAPSSSLVNSAQPELVLPKLPQVKNPADKPIVKENKEDLESIAEISDNSHNEKKQSDPAPTLLKKVEPESIGNIWANLAEKSKQPNPAPKSQKSVGAKTKYQDLDGGPGLPSGKTKAPTGVRDPKRVPFPRNSWLTSKQQKDYLVLKDRFMNCNHAQLNQIQSKDFNQFKELHKLVAAEQTEFMAHLEHVAQINREDYSYMNESVHKYIMTRLKKLQQRVKLYPRHYMMLDSVPIAPPKSSQNIPFFHIKTLLEIGDIVKVIIPKITEQDGRRLCLKGSHIEPRFPVCNDHQLNPPCSHDENIDRLSKKFVPHVVISSSTLKCILDNQSPSFQRQWEIPVRIKSTSYEENGETKQHKIIILDKPLVSKNLSMRERNHLYHKLAVKFHMQHPKHPSTKSFGNQRPEEETDQVEDLCGIETFGFETANGKSHVQTLQPEPPMSNSTDVSQEGQDDKNLNEDSDAEALVIDAELSPLRRVTRSQSDSKTDVKSELKRRTSTSSDLPNKRTRTESECRELRSRKVVLSPPAALSTSTTIKEDSPQPSVSEEKPVDKSNLMSSNLFKEDSEWIACEKAENYELPKTGHNMAYNLWQLGEFRMLIRCKYHGHAKQRKNQEPFLVTLSPKMEYQPKFGMEQITYSEACREWVSCAIRKDCHLVRARINAFTSEIMRVDIENPSSILQRPVLFNPIAGLSVLHAFIKKIYQLSEGHYLITHTAGNPQAQIKKMTQSTVGVYDLHDRSEVGLPANASVPWIPIDPNIMTHWHVKSKRIPACFCPKFSNLDQNQKQKGSQNKKKKRKKNK